MYTAHKRSQPVAIPGCPPSDSLHHSEQSFTPNAPYSYTATPSLITNPLREQQKRYTQGGSIPRNSFCIPPTTPQLPFPLDETLSKEDEPRTPELPYALEKPLPADGELDRLLQQHKSQPTPHASLLKRHTTASATQPRIHPKGKSSPLKTELAIRDATPPLRVNNNGHSPTRRRVKFPCQPDPMLVNRAAKSNYESDNDESDELFEFEMD